MTNKFDEKKICCSFKHSEIWCFALRLELINHKLRYNKNPTSFTFVQQPRNL